MSKSDSFLVRIAKVWLDNKEYPNFVAFNPQPNSRVQNLKLFLGQQKLTL